MSARPILCITGTTGSGKNEIGARAARRLGGEVLSLDSMKVYRGMDIGTAKPTPAQQALAKHHLIDILDPRDGMHLKRFIEMANDVIASLEREGKTPVIVGGTAMYLMGLLYGVYEGPSRDDDFRAVLAAERDERGVPALHARLGEIDPAAAAKIDPNDYKRIERALEVHASTGRAPSELRTGWFTGPRRPASVYIITWPRDLLRRRIEKRVDEMLVEGWIDEVRRLRDQGGFGREAAMALGYREILAFLDDQLTLDECSTLIKTRTWQFSRRQMTWMKKLPDAVTISLEPGADLDLIVDRIVGEFRGTV